MSPITNIPDAAFIEKNMLATAGRWLWLYEIEVPVEGSIINNRYRFIRDTDPVTFRGNVYSPFPVTHTVTKQDDRGGLPSVSLSVSNVSREIIATLESNNGLIGQPVRVLLTHEFILTTGESIIEHDFKVTGTVATEEGVQMGLGDLSMYDSYVPAQRMLRSYCRHQYRGPGCGYSVDEADTFYLAACDKSLDGPNGCVVHGTSESDAGVAVLHPDRFGGFPGIPVPTTLGAL